MLIFSGCSSDPRQISRGGSGAYEASLTPFNGGFAAAWYDTRDGNPEIYFRLVDADGSPRGPERRLTDDPELSYEADIVAAGDALAVAWYDKTQAGKLTARLGLWTRDGERRWMTAVSSVERDGRNPVVRVSGDRLFCAWLEDADGDRAEVWAGWWDLNGGVVSAPRRLAPAGRTTWNLNAAIDGGGRAWIVFDAKAGTRSEELFLVHTTQDTSEVARLTEDDGFASKYPDLAFGEGSTALTWFDERDGNQEVYLFVGPMDEIAASGAGLRGPASEPLRVGRGPTIQTMPGIQLRARRVTQTPGESIGSYVAWNGQRFGLAWCDNTTDGQHEVYFQLFDSEGRPLSDPRRLTQNTSSSLIPAIRPWGDTFALAWNEYTPPESGAHDMTLGRSDIAFTIIP